MAANTDTLWFLKSTRPVLFPQHEALALSQQDFDKYIANELKNHAFSPFKFVVRVGGETKAETDDGEKRNPFMEGLHRHNVDQHILNRTAGRDMANKTLTTNGDVAHVSTNDALVDLFHELTDTVDGGRLVALLDAAWAEDAAAALKIIFNARSIHLGKSMRKVFYRAAGWLAQNHPRTLIANLPWLCRPVIEKKRRKKTANKEADSDLDIVSLDSEDEDDDGSRFDVQYGVSHGYWKDLLNMLALAVNRKLSPMHDPADVLNVEDLVTKRLAIFKRQNGKTRSTWRTQRDIRRRTLRIVINPGKLEELAGQAPAVHPINSKKDMREHRHKNATNTFALDPLYRALHLAVARLFAEQLRSDVYALRHGDDTAKKAISLCAKWAPSDDHFHERHTFIISSIAESLYPREQVAAVDDATDTREVYLRHARELYRRDVSALRKHLDIVERKVTSKAYGEISYTKVPSLAMDAHKMTFIKKDTEHFGAYLDDVASGKAKTSGATLLPSAIMRQLREMKGYPQFPHRSYAYPGGDGYGALSEFAMQHMGPLATMQYKINLANATLLDGQWKALVARMEQSGSLESCIAICDTSGSMLTRLADGATALDSAIGLSMLVAEVTKPPFRGSFITFSTTPRMVRLKMEASVAEKRLTMASSSWHMTTDFVSVFRDLILPVAVKNNIAPEDMVKRVFVFSDMQFNAAQAKRQGGGDDGQQQGMMWQSSYEVIKGLYKEAGYDVPELVFWDLAGKAHGGAAAKPITAADVGTVLVSGYSQGMLKVFMDGGSFKDAESGDDEQNVEMMDEDGDGDAVMINVDKRSKTTSPRALVEKAISHPAYRMLAVYD